MIIIKYIPIQIQNKIEKFFSYLEKEQIEITSEPNGLCIIINDEIDDVKLCLVE